MVPLLCPRRMTATYQQTKSFKKGNRSAPKGRQQMGETGFCKNLRFSAVSCENLRFSAVFCANLRLPNPLIYRASRKSAKICKNLRKCAFRVRFLPFAVSLLARPEARLQTPNFTKGLRKGACLMFQLQLSCLLLLFPVELLCLHTCC